MSEKFEVLEVGGDGKPKKIYSFDPEAEYNGHKFIKFQRKTISNYKDKEEVKWQTLTVALDDWTDFAEWLNYIFEEMHNRGDGQFSETPSEDIPF